MDNLKKFFEVRTQNGEKRFTVDQFAGWFARFQAMRHAKKLIKYGDAKIAEVFKVRRIKTYE